MAETTFNGRRGLPIGRVLLAVALVALVVRTVDILLVLFLSPGRHTIRHDVDSDFFTGSATYSIVVGART